MFRKRHSERRQGYSFWGHFRRALRTKGVASVFGPLGATALVAAIAFAHCSKNTITGPSAPSTATPTNPPAPTGPGKGMATVSQPKQAIAVFPTNLLPAVHPCDPTVIFDAMSGENDITYTDEVLYNSDGTPSGQHKITYDSNEKQQGRDKNGYNYAGNKQSFGQSFFISNKYELVTHFDVSPLAADGTAQPCTMTSNVKNGNTGGNCLRSSPTYDFVLVEDPVTHEGTLAVTTVAIESSCPATTTLGMLDP